MAKLEMKCPFNGMLCRECGIYRGRHYYMCFSNHYRGRLVESHGADIEAESKEHADKTFGIPENIILSESCIRNAEERLMEAQSGSKNTERRERDDKRF